MSISVSFGIEEESKWLSYFQQNGFVVIRDVLTKEQVNATVDEIWQHSSLLAAIPSLNRNDPLTWTNDAWPGGEVTDRKGFLSPKSESTCKCTWENRQNPKIVSIYSKLFQVRVEDLQVEIGRFGYMRPTKIKVVQSDGFEQVKEMNEWKTASNWLHFDQNPFTQPKFTRLQGLLALTEHNEKSGGFECVPGFHEHFEQWGKSQTPTENELRYTLIKVPKDDEMLQRVQKILMPKGSLLVWDSRIPHCNYPNSSFEPRIVQYITYKLWKDQEQKEEMKRQMILLAIEGKIKEEDEEKQKEKQTEKEKCFLNYLTPLGYKLIGFEGEEAWKLEDVLTPDELEKTIKAMKFLKEAEEMEANGDSMSASNLYRKAFKMSPFLSKVYGQ